MDQVGSLDDPRPIGVVQPTLLLQDLTRQYLLGIFPPNLFPAVCYIFEGDCVSRAYSLREKKRIMLRSSRQSAEAKLLARLLALEVPKGPGSFPGLGIVGSTRGIGR